MTVGVVSPYFGTIGGGERYALTVACFFLQNGHRVDIFSGPSLDGKQAIKFFNLDLAGANFVDDWFAKQTTLWQRLKESSHYDLLFFLSDGSIPASLAKKNWLHFQTPFRYTDQRTLVNKIKLGLFQHVICNSYFTKKYIDETYGVKSQVVYPPVDVKSFSNASKKENIILAVGRFSSPQDLGQHPKKQEILVTTFKKLVDGGLSGWKLVLVGSFDRASGFIDSLKKQSQGYPVEISTNASFSSLRQHYASARIFWQAVGFGEDLGNFPARAEHFGITTVEAMAAGVVPVVFDAGGQKEIVEEGKSGYLWQTITELKGKTLLLANRKDLREKMVKAAIARAQYFSSKRFFDHLEKLL